MGSEMCIRDRDCGVSCEVTAGASKPLDSGGGGAEAGAGAAVRCPNELMKAPNVVLPATDMPPSSPPPRAPPPAVATSADGSRSSSSAIDAIDAAAAAAAAAASLELREVAPEADERQDVPRERVASSPPSSGDGSAGVAGGAAAPGACTAKTSAQPEHLSGRTIAAA